jgi:hypothetical protein
MKLDIVMPSKFETTQKTIRAYENYSIQYNRYTGRRRRRYRMVVGFITTNAISIPISTNVANSNPTQARCTRYNIV